MANPAACKAKQPPFAKAKTAGPVDGAGRSLEPGGDAGSREMVAAFASGRR